MKIPGYSIERLIGKGGMSSVYLAVQESLNRRVALKVMKKFDDPRQAERFVHEGRVIAALNHRNIITIHDVGTARDRHFIAMEYLQGRALTERIEEGMPLAKALSLLEQMAACLHFVHRRGIIHRDIKPSNILFHADGTPKLTDFGIAKLLDADQELTLEGNALGSPYYLSPEQAEGLQLDGRSDIYSLGIVFYQMLTGQRPYAKATPVETIVAHLTQPLPVLPEQYLGYQDLLESMIAKSPDDRVASAKELVHRIRESKRLTPPGERAGDRSAPPSTPVAEPASARRRTVPVLAAAGAVLALMIGYSVLQPGVDAPPGAVDAALPEKPIVPVVAADVGAAGAAPEPQPESTRPEPPSPLAAPAPPPQDLAIAPASQPNPSDTVLMASPAEVPQDAATDTLPEADVAVGQAPFDSLPALPASEPASEPSIDGTADDVVAGLEAVTPPGNDLTAVEPPAADAVDDDAQQIEQWMQAATQALDGLRLTRPPNDNAYLHYRRVLAQDPQHAGAQAGLREIAARYRAMAEKALQRDNPKQARRLVRRGLSVRPGDRSLRALRERIDVHEQAPVLAYEVTPVEVPTAAGPPPPPAQPQSLRDREGSGNIVKDFKRVWRSVFD